MWQKNLVEFCFDSFCHHNEVDKYGYNDENINGKHILDEKNDLTVNGVIYKYFYYILYVARKNQLSFIRTINKKRIKKKTNLVVFPFFMFSFVSSSIDNFCCNPSENRRTLLKTNYLMTFSSFVQ